MKQVYRFDSEGNYIEPILLQNGQQIPKDCTDIELPQPNWKPVWNGTDWIETITEEEKAALIKYPEPTPLEQVQKDQADLMFQLMLKGVI